MPPPYTCLRCGFVTNRRSSLRNHLARRRSCPAIVHNISCVELLSRLNHGELDEDTTLVCELCSKKFTCYSALRYHCVNNVCEKLVASSSTQPTTSQLRHLVGHNIEDADLNVFGTETVDHIGLTTIMDTFADKRLLDATIVQYIYFHSEVPQNQNVLYVNNTTIAIYTRYGWRNRNATDIGNYIFEFLVFKVLKCPDVLERIQNPDTEEDLMLADFFNYWTTLIEKKGRRSFECRSAVNAIIREIKENTSSHRVRHVQDRAHRPI